jgi:hypothetical protein
MKGFLPSLELGQQLSKALWGSRSLTNSASFIAHFSLLAMELFLSAVLSESTARLNEVRKALQESLQVVVEDEGPAIGLPRSQIALRDQFVYRGAAQIRDLRRFSNRIGEVVLQLLARATKDRRLRRITL